jgi:hypothetical protein
MNTRPTLLLMAALGSLALLAGCDPAPERQPKTTRTLFLRTDQPAPDVELGLVSAIRIVLPGPQPGSGLAWEIASNNTTVLEQMGPMRSEAAPATSVSFYALRPGKSVIRFYLLDPKLAEAVPAATCKVTVRVVE